MAKWTCANCERTAGNLEKPVVWEGNLICVECLRRLQSQQGKPTLVELTDKRWKRLGLRGAIVACVGMGAVVALGAIGAAWPHAPAVVTGVLGLAGIAVFAGTLYGVGVLIYAAAMSWWHNG